MAKVLNETEDYVQSCLCAPVMPGDLTRRSMESPKVFEARVVVFLLLLSTDSFFSLNFFMMYVRGVAPFHMP